MIMETVAVTNESRRACKASGLVSTAPASVQGARTSSPTSGISRNSSASTAGMPSNTGVAR